MTEIEAVQENPAWRNNTSQSFSLSIILNAYLRYFFIFPPNDSPSKTMKYAFYFI